MKVFLIGMMGSGKSFWSKQMSRKLRIPAYDLDDCVEKRAGKTIAEMFRTEGETYFRLAESDALRQFAHIENAIIATGGGTPCFNDNIQWMNENGITIWIDEAPEVLAKRLKPEKAHRPLVQKLSDEELIFFLQNKIEERKLHYHQAQHRLQGDAINEDNLLNILY